MAEAKSSKMVEVNLLPGDDLEGRPGGKFLKWALGWGKRIVIVTEGIVILAFLSRFWLDTTVADLGEKIEVRRGSIEASANFEKKFRTTTAQIAHVKSLEEQVSPLTIWEKASPSIGKEITVSTMILTTSEIRIGGNGDEQSLALLVTNFGKSADFTDLVIEKVSKVSSTQKIDFSMQATYVGKPKQTL